MLLVSPFTKNSRVHLSMVSLATFVSLGEFCPQEITAAATERSLVVALFGKSRFVRCLITMAASPTSDTKSVKWNYNALHGNCNLEMKVGLGWCWNEWKMYWGGSRGGWSRWFLGKSQGFCWHIPVKVKGYPPGSLTARPWKTIVFLWGSSRWRLKKHPASRQRRSAEWMR